MDFKYKKMKKFLLVFMAMLSIISISCQQKNGGYKKEKLKIVETKPTKTITPFKEKWARGKIATKWIRVEKDKKGYLIYEPCDGNTPSIDFTKNKNLVEINYNLESENIDYEYITYIQNDNNLFIDISKNKKNIKSFRIKEFDSKNQLVTIEFDGIKWLMTPFENIDCFRKLENVCKDHKVSELEFSPIDIE